MPAKWAGRPVLARWQLKRPMYDFKNSFSSAFVYIHRAKYIFSRDMFCLPYLWAKIHCVSFWISPLDGNWHPLQKKLLGLESRQNKVFDLVQHLVVNFCNKVNYFSFSLQPLVMTKEKLRRTLTSKIDGEKNLLNSNNYFNSIDIRNEIS